MFDKIWAFFSAIEGAGTEVIDEFFFSMGSGLFSKLLWGLLGLIVDILWGILVYGSPIIIPVVIYKIISGNRLSKGISELANGLIKRSSPPVNERVCITYESFPVSFRKTTGPLNWIRLR